MLSKHSNDRHHSSLILSNCMFHSVSTNHRPHRTLKASWFVFCTLQKNCATQNTPLLSPVECWYRVMLFSLKQLLGNKWKKQAGPFETPFSWTLLQSSDACNAFAAAIFCISVCIVCLTEQRNCWVLLRNEISKWKPQRPSQFLSWLVLLMKAMVITVVQQRTKAPKKFRVAQW